VISFMPRPLYPQGKSPWYPLDWRMGGPQRRSGLGVEEKIPTKLIVAACTVKYTWCQGELFAFNPEIRKGKF